jgi:hypothetical protein
LAPASAVAGRNAGNSGGCKGGAGTSLFATQNYRFELHIGMPEKMYTAAQVEEMHPKNGEMMMSGDMSEAGMSMGSVGATRHLEVQICSKKTGAVITNAHPAITVRGAMGMTTHMSSATMRGVGAGMDDTHYGNNARLPMGQALTIKVALRGETAAFHHLAMHAQHD